MSGKTKRPKLWLMGPVLIASLAALALAATAQVQPPRHEAQAVSTGGQVLEAPAPVDPRVSDTLRRINAYRAAGATCGHQRFEPAPPLAWSAQLEQAAAKHAQDMAARRALSHTGGDGSSLSQRVGRESYAWSALGENVSMGYETVPAGLAGWLKSPGHCTNLMASDFREVGVAGAQARDGALPWYRAMVLGSPARQSAGRLSRPNPPSAQEAP